MSSKATVSIAGTHFYSGINSTSDWYWSRSEGFFEVHMGRVFVGFVR